MISNAVTLACTVCYGDPASPLTKGAQAGVIVLGIAIFAMLLAFGGLFLFWMRRAKALERQLAATTNAERIVDTGSDAPAMTAAPREDAAAATPLTLH